MSKILSKEEQLKLRNRIKTELLRLESLENDKETIQLVDEFKRKFSICEIVYKIILKKQQEGIKGKNKHLKLIISQVKPALNYAGYNYEEELMKKLFSSNTKVGERTVKSLRDILTHELNNSAINELKNRKEELFSYMNFFYRND